MCCNGVALYSNEFIFQKIYLEKKIFMVDQSWGTHVWARTHIRSTKFSKPISAHFLFWLNWFYQSIQLNIGPLESLEYIDVTQPRATRKVSTPRSPPPKISTNNELPFSWRHWQSYDWLWRHEMGVLYWLSFMEVEISWMGPERIIRCVMTSSKWRQSIVPANIELEGTTG